MSFEQGFFCVCFCIWFLVFMVLYIRKRLRERIFRKADRCEIVKSSPFQDDFMKDMSSYILRFYKGASFLGEIPGIRSRGKAENIASHILNSSNPTSKSRPSEKIVGEIVKDISSEGSLSFIEPNGQLSHSDDKDYD